MDKIQKYSEEMSETIKKLVHNELVSQGLVLRFVEITISNWSDMQYNVFNCQLSGFCERRVHYQALFTIFLRHKFIYPAILTTPGEQNVYTVGNFAKLKQIISAIVAQEDIRKFIEQTEYLSGIDCWRDAMLSREK